MKKVLFLLLALGVSYEACAMEVDSPEEHEQEFFDAEDVLKASRREDLAEFESFIKQKDFSPTACEIPVTYFDENSYNPKIKYTSLLHKICEEKNTAALACLLEKWPEINVNIKDEFHRYPYEYIDTSDEAIKLASHLLCELYTLLFKHGLAWNLQYIPALKNDTCKMPGLDAQRAQIAECILSHLKRQAIERFNFISQHLLPCLMKADYATAKIILWYLWKHAIPLDSSIRHHIKSDGITLIGKKYLFDPKTRTLIRFYTHLEDKMPDVANDKKCYFSRLPAELQYEVMLYLIKDCQEKEVPDRWCSIQ